MKLGVLRARAASAPMAASAQAGSPAEAYLKFTAGAASRGALRHRSRATA
jgi:hypothetical protein